MIDPLTPPAPTPVLSLISTTKVPNIFPTVDVPYRLAIIGDAPGSDEEAYGSPFVGAAGNLFDSILASVNILRSGCFVGNVCKYRPPGNDIKAFGNDHAKVLEGWTELQNELKTYAPHCILALGETPLHFFTGRAGISSWRGSILQTPCGKVVPAIHPSAVLRDYKDWVLLRFDAQRARTEAESDTLSLPQRTLELNLSAYEICNRLDNWPAGRLLSFDIEGGLDAFPCCSVAGESNTGFIIAWSKHSDTEQARIACSLSRVLYSSTIPKVLQNSLYDRFVLAYAYRMLIRNVVEDTMLKQWEVYPELPKGLGTIASIWTREPYYKFEGGRGNKELISQNEHEAQKTYHRYCIKDSCVTLEACLAQDNALSDSARRHYRFNIELLSPLLYMELRGIRYDKTTANTELAGCRAALVEAATRLELRCGYSLLGAKGSISSTKLKRCLYSEKAYPEQKTGRGPTARVTTDVEALLNLQRKFPNDAFLADILLHRKLESIKETLAVSTDQDGRVRCGYNLVGTETGRLTCYTSPTGSGANLQTITKKLRKLYIADEGYHLFQCDLSGADGWTVAARCLAHGDSAMWDDYRFGLKPALIIALMYLGTATNKTSREDLLRLSRAFKTWEAENPNEAWLYFGAKRVQHMTNYAGQARTGVKQVMIDSYKLTGKPVYMAERDFDALQRLYFVRYPGLYQWHNDCKRKVFDGKNLVSASSHERKFFGRRKSWNPKTRSVEADHDTWKEYLADEPQENTTYATNLALHKLWNDPENRSTVSRRTVPLSLELHPACSLRIEPLHQVHDAIIGQFPKHLTDWAISRIRSYFSNELLIANTKLTIPFEGSYGPSWGELGPSYGGGDI